MGKKRAKVKNLEKLERPNLSSNIDEWTKEQVKQWVTEELKIDQKYGEILVSQDVTGSALKLFTLKDLKDIGITHGPALQIMDALKCNFLVQSRAQLVRQEDSEKTLDKKYLTEKEDGQSAKQDEKDKGKSKTGDTSESQELRVSECTESIKSVLTDAIENKVDEAKGKSEKLLENNQHPTRQNCLPYPFDEFHDSRRYIQHNLLNVPETGPLNLIEPAHEFKLLTNTENATEEEIKMKFSKETFRFAAACMNSRTNGTIHFGVSNKPHGEIIGVKLTNKDEFIDEFNNKIEKYFEKSFVSIAKACIREPRFVEVLLQNNTPSNTFVIEVDVVPKHSICEATFFYTNNYNFKSKTCERSLFVRDGASSKNIYNNPKEHESFKSRITFVADCRKEAEEEQKEKRKKKENEGRKLINLLTGNKDLLDNSYYDWYILVTNKSHPSQIQHLDFLQEVKWFAVLEFDSQSENNGMAKKYREKRGANLHFPSQYHMKGKAVPEIIEDLNLYYQPTWIFCNGRSDLNDENYQPLNPCLWQQKRAAEVRKLISFLSNPDVLQRGKFLVVFLLLSEVEDPGDPLIETFCTFYQELEGLEDMLCICIGAQTFQLWKDLLEARFINPKDLTERCVANLNLPAVNGTILKLKSMTQSSQRLLPCKGSSTVLLKKEEDFMTALEILCENECADTDIEKDKTQFSEFIKSQEENFYRGGKVTWWNFYFSSENYSSPFIKRDSYEKLEELIQSSSQSSTQTSTKVINLYHSPGCGGTTLAMHVLWELRKKFRCVVLKNKTVDFAEIATQLTTLITYGATDQDDYLPILLLVDDFEEQENVYFLQREIQSAIVGKCIRYENPLVIIINCMRSQNPVESSKSSQSDSINLKHQLSSKEQRAFEKKLEEIKQQHQHPEDFYSFMIMKEQFNPEYIKNVVKNTLKGLDISSKQGQLISFLAILNSYVTESTISVSQCEDFLGIIGKYWGKESLEDKMGICSNILIQSQVQDYGTYKGVRITHPLIADCCLEEFNLTYGLTKSSITLQLLKENLFYDSGLGRRKLIDDVQSMLLTRQRKEHGDDADTLFSPLIEKIQMEEGSAAVESVLCEGALRFSQNPFICQALARHYYIIDKNFVSALEWANKAKKRAPRNSYISDTLGQVFKSQIKIWVDENAKRKVITAEDLKHLLDLAKCASEAFKDSQAQNESTENVREALQLQKSKRRYDTYNTSGYLGEIETGLYTIDILGCTPLFKKKNTLSQEDLLQYLSGQHGILTATGDTEDQEFKFVLDDYRNYLSNLRSSLKEAFEFFENYFVLLKPRNIEKENVELKTRKRVRECFKKYAEIFCLLNPEKLGDNLMSSKLSLPWQVEHCRRSLEASKADRFPGLLEYLNSHEKPESNMEDIVNKYKFLIEKCSYGFKLKEKQNFILANIILSCIKPKSKKICALHELKEQLRKMLQHVGLEHRFAAPYFLASLLFWPEKEKQLDEDSRQMERYVTALKKSFRGQYKQICRYRQTIAHFYLGRREGLNRLVHKGKIDQFFSKRQGQDLHSWWQKGCIWEEKAVQNLLLRLNGKVTDDFVFVDYGIDEKISIPVRPAFLGQVRSGKCIERGSFYLGFSMDGPIAYDIQMRV
nr:LOW QUALITY PROTEIN: sterile alpha motif domain-containing protein 9-like [Pelodiscus sinensis]|eukprot:XP_006139744.1 LOW QUALITY PROTEIN: sterile alpha motif domain-containing protein 9-like [Pelodiscus sinensis]